MGKKAVYNNKGLAIYITGEDFDEWFSRFNLVVPVFIGKDKTPAGDLDISLSIAAHNSLRRAFILEQAAIDTVRNQHLTTIRSAAEAVIKERKG